MKLQKKNKKMKQSLLLSQYIDFEAHEAKVNVVMNIVMGFNLPLVEGKTSIDEKNSQIKMLTNQLNRKLSLLENICITKDNRIIYGKVMEAN
jgi:hypothetical protein